MAYERAETQPVVTELLGAGQAGGQAGRITCLGSPALSRKICTMGVHD